MEGCERSARKVGAEPVRLNQVAICERQDTTKYCMDTL
jgi:hypothetical protein